MYERKNRDNQKQLKIMSLEDLVPQDHILRVIDPASLFKIVFLQHLFGIRSMRQTIKEIEVNMAYRWFIGYDIGEDIPHFSTFGKNYSRRFKDTDVFEQIFMHILQEAIECGFVDASTLFIDSKHVKANANKKKKLKKEVPVEAKRYKQQLECEINQDRERHGKKPFKHDNDDGDFTGTSVQETKTVTGSTTDPECGVFRKGEHETCFAYTVHTGCDRHNFILGVEVSAGNVHDSVMFDPLYEQLDRRFPEAEAIVVDTGYKTPWIMKKIIDDGRAAVTGYKRPMTKKGFCRKYDYVYDQYNDWLICPAGEVLRYATTDREGYREYKSDARKCRECEHLHECTKPGGVKAEVTLIYACMNLKKLAIWKQKNGLLRGGTAYLIVWIAKMQTKYMKRGIGACSNSPFVYNLPAALAAGIFCLNRKAVVIKPYSRYFLRFDVSAEKKIPRPSVEQIIERPTPQNSACLVQRR